jgi:hypothetical protein
VRAESWSLKPSSLPRSAGAARSAKLGGRGDEREIPAEPEAEEENAVPSTLSNQVRPMQENAIRTRPE